MTALAGRAPHRLGAVDTWRMIQDGTLTVSAVVGSLLDRIGEREDEVRAWSHVDRAAALARAAELDRGPRGGLLFGVPVGVKDVIDVAGMPTRGGAPELYPDEPAATDARTVALVREQGGLVLGKTASARYGMMIPGETSNPLDPTRSPGASSSGSAAAVADHMVPLALGTQTAGSLLRPAAYCGVVGLKPTFGLVSRQGSLELSARLDTIGCLARDVADASLLLAGLTGSSVYLPPEPHEGRVTVGVHRGADVELAAPYVHEQFESACGVLARAGFRLVDVEPGEEFAALGELQDLIARRDTCRRFARYGFGEDSPLDPRLVEYCDQATRITDDGYEAALREADRLARSFAAAAAGVDVLLTPATLTDAPPKESTGTSEFLRSWTLLGNPTLSLPFGTSPAGLPLAVQLVGHHGDDTRLLSIARAVEAVLGA